MHEWQERRQQWRYMGYNLVAFTIIFGLFALIIYLQLTQSLYSRVDEDLYRAREAIQDTAAFVEMQLNMHMGVQPGGGRENKEEPPPNPPQEDIQLPERNEGGAKIVINNRNKVYIPIRVQVILRDEQTEVQNGYTLGRIFLEDVVETIPFSVDRLDAVQAFRLEDGSNYRSLSFRINDSQGQAYYIQLLAGSDGEQGIIDSFLHILIVFALIFILVSIGASYLLSKKNMRPLIRAWERQVEFVENASHELRTPLTIIQNKLESLLTTPQATVLDRADNVAISLSETRRLSKLTGDLMTLARADSSAPQLQKSQIKLDELIENLSGPYREFAEAEEKTMELDLGFGGELYADKGRIHELMVILLDNALKYTREGDTIRITTLQRENKAVIRVSDTGIGISEESMARIFDRFYREDKARSREKGGTGLGLSIAQWIVSTHSGSIKAERNMPAGTIFEIKLPMK